MAKQEKIILSGRVSNLVFYVRNGVPCVRTAVPDMKQTRATKRSAGQFGQAVQVAKALRMGLYPVLPDPKDRKMMHRLDNAVLQSIRNGLEKRSSLQILENLPMNEDYAFWDRLKIPLSINWTTPRKIIVNIPFTEIRTHIVAPAHTSAIKLRLVVTGCNMSNYSNTGMQSIDLEWPYQGTLASQTISLPFTVKSNSLTVMAARIIYIAETKKGKQEVQLKRWLPAGVIGAFFKNIN